MHRSIHLLTREAVSSVCSAFSAYQELVLAGLLEKPIPEKSASLKVIFAYSVFNIWVMIVAPEPPMFCAIPVLAPATCVSPHSFRSCCTTSTT